MLVRFRKDRTAFEVGGIKFPPTRQGLRDALVRYGEMEGAAGLNEILPVEYPPSELEPEGYTLHQLFEILPLIRAERRRGPDPREIGW
jgi:hypothetical protein